MGEEEGVEVAVADFMLALPQRERLRFAGRQTFGNCPMAGEGCVPMVVIRRRV